MSNGENDGLRAELAETQQANNRLRAEIERLEHNQMSHGYTSLQGWAARARC